MAEHTIEIIDYNRFINSNSDHFIELKNMEDH